MHIAIDARIINTSTGRYVERLIHYLEKIDTVNRYTILVPPKDKGFYKPTNPNFTVETIDFDNYSFAEQVGFKRYLDRLQPDLVHFAMPQQPVFYKGRKVTTFHDLTLLNTYNSDKNWLVFHVKQLIGRWVFKSVAKSSQQIITPSQYTKDDLVRFAKIDPRKVTVTYESADPHPGELSPYPHPFKRYLLYVGQQSDYKNVQRLGDAHQKLLSDHPDLGLILVGKKNQSAQSNEAYFSAKDYKNILFTDFVTDSERDWLYKNATAYVFPSLMEGFGLPGLEAMGYGLPVVSSNATCLPEVYGAAAHYFDPLDTTSMKEAIDTILTDEPLRQSLIKKGYEQLAKYSWERMAEQTLEVYQQALEGSNA